MGTREEREGLRVAIRGLLEADRASGNLKPLPHYKNLFPGFWDIVGEEAARLDAEATRRGPVEPEPEPSHPAPATAPESAPAPELETIGPYRVLRELGHGGMGVVYLAEDTRLPRNVALKVLPPQFASSRQLQARFQREAALASKLDHPNICTVYEAGESDGTAYMAMRLVEGKTLAELVAESRARKRPSGVVTLPQDEPEGTAKAGSGERKQEVDRVLALGEKVARALHAAHEKGLIHRDIKPHNIMVTEAGEPVLLDFGLARDEEGEGHGLTQTGTLMGTPAYMSPEQLMAQRVKVDRRTDVYSLGVSLYECFTLRLPFDAPTTDRLYQQILTSDPENPRRLNPAIPDDLRVVLETALEKDRDRRYQTALDLAEELRRVREFEPIHARPAGLWTKGFRFARRNRGAVVATGVTSLCVGAIAWGLLAGRLGQTPESFLITGQTLQEQGQTVAARAIFEVGVQRLTEGAPATPTVARSLREGLGTLLLQEIPQDLKAGAVVEAKRKAAAGVAAVFRAELEQETLAIGLRRKVVLCDLLLAGGRRDESALDAALAGFAWRDGSVDVRELLREPSSPLGPAARFALVHATATPVYGGFGEWFAEGPPLPPSLVPDLVRLLPGLEGRWGRAASQIEEMAKAAGLLDPVAHLRAIEELCKDPSLDAGRREFAVRLLALGADLPFPPGGTGTEVEEVLALHERTRGLDRSDGWRARVETAVAAAAAGNTDVLPWLRARTGRTGGDPAEGWARWWEGRKERDPRDILVESMGVRGSAAAGTTQEIYEGFLSSDAAGLPGWHTLLGLSLPVDVPTPTWHPGWKSESPKAPARLVRAWTRCLAGRIAIEPVRVALSWRIRRDWQEEPEELGTESVLLRPGEPARVRREIRLAPPPLESWPVKLRLSLPGTRMFQLYQDDESPDLTFETYTLNLELAAERLAGGHSLLVSGVSHATGNRSGGIWGASYQTAGGQPLVANYTCWSSRFPETFMQEIVVLARVEEGTSGNPTGTPWAESLGSELRRVASEIRGLAMEAPDDALTRQVRDLWQRASRTLLAVPFVPCVGLQEDLRELDSALLEFERRLGKTRGKGSQTYSLGSARIRTLVARLECGDVQVLDEPAPSGMHRPHLEWVGVETWASIALSASDSRIRTAAWERTYMTANNRWWSGGTLRRVRAAVSEGRLPGMVGYDRAVLVNHGYTLDPPGRTVLTVLSGLLGLLVLALLWPAGGLEGRMRPAVLALGVSTILLFFDFVYLGGLSHTDYLGVVLGVPAAWILASRGTGWLRFLPPLLLMVFGTCLFLASTMAGYQFNLWIAGSGGISLALYFVLLPGLEEGLLLARRGGLVPRAVPTIRFPFWKGRAFSRTKLQMLAGGILLAPFRKTFDLASSGGGTLLLALPYVAWHLWVLWTLWQAVGKRVGNPSLAERAWRRLRGTSPNVRAAASAPSAPR